MLWIECDDECDEPHEFWKVGKNLECLKMLSDVEWKNLSCSALPFGLFLSNSGPKILATLGDFGNAKR